MNISKARRACHLQSVCPAEDILHSCRDCAASDRCQQRCLKTRHSLSNPRTTQSKRIVSVMIVSGSYSAHCWLSVREKAPSFHHSSTIQQLLPITVNVIVCV